ncbi:hypothetical protein AM629_11865 [Photorhabdus heterorhabditis]|uniref:Uncharacterized protein n=1 Tax=Photorhabdus heterorhabditis TaxID=880156 RepID=A0ABR5KB81_9GAMM|nr:hypothetical protein [Photorhabdus heterorhabditis]KOY61849.1 hypothetical protein AM629_11865 [Photorhabdus heterorhabditis]
MKKILIICMRTWGRMGNYEAAKKIESELASKEIFSAELICFDELVPVFSKFGLRMQEIAASYYDPHIKLKLYDELIDDIDSWISNFNNEKVLNESLSSVIENDFPSLIISTKGVIAKVVHAFKKKFDFDFKTVNFITNPGLLDIKIHQHFSSDLTIRTTSYYPNSDMIKKFHRLETVPLFKPVSNYQIEQKDIPSILILCNGCEEGYFDVLKTSFEHPSKPKIFMVIVSNKKLYDECIDLNRKYADRAYIYNTLANKDYLKLALEASTNNGSFLYSKSGPNTVLESIRFNLPVLVHFSGLPMERWIVELTNKRKFGFCFENQSNGPSLIKRWLDNPEIVTNFKRNIESSKIDDIDVTLKDLSDIIYDVM